MPYAEQYNSIKMHQIDSEEEQYGNSHSMEPAFKNPHSMDYRKIPLETKKVKHQKSMINKLDINEINQGVIYDQNGRGRV